MWRQDIPGATKTVSAPGRAKSVRKLGPGILETGRLELSGAIAKRFSVLEHLPVLSELGSIRPRTRSVRSHEEERVFTRIRGLLSKAESSDFAEEADAFMAKAQELMTRYCIDRTMVNADAGGHDPPQVEARRVWLEDPYLEAKALLLANVASANRCRAVVDPEFGYSTLVGHAEDVDATDLLFTSLLVQATRRITALGNDPALGRRSRKPSYRRSFLVAYAGKDRFASFVKPTTPRPLWPMKPWATAYCPCWPAESNSSMPPWGLCSASWES